MNATALIAVNLPATVKLKLGATRKMPRDLVIELCRHKTELRALIALSREATLAFANAELGECRLDAAHHDTVNRILWLGAAAFDVTPGEAEAIAAQFEAHGLRVDR